MTPPTNDNRRPDCPDCDGFQDIPFFNSLGDEIGSVICERCRSDDQPTTARPGVRSDQ